MGNISRDMSKMWVQIEHPNLGAINMNEHLHNIKISSISDTEVISEPGVGGGRRFDEIKDTARKITIEVATGSPDELFLNRMRLFTGAAFTLQWEDARVGILDIMGGNGSDCRIIKSRDNDRSAENQEFEIISLSYTGD